MEDRQSLLTLLQIINGRGSKSQKVDRFESEFEQWIEEVRGEANATN